MTPSRFNGSALDTSWFDWTQGDPLPPPLPTFTMGLRDCIGDERTASQQRVSLQRRQLIADRIAAIEAARLADAAARQSDYLDQQRRLANTAALVSLHTEALAASFDAAVITTTGHWNPPLDPSAGRLYVTVEGDDEALAAVRAEAQLDVERRR